MNQNHYNLQKSMCFSHYQIQQNPSQLLSYFKPELPMPITSLQKKFHTLPNQLQTQQNYKTINNINDQILQQKFSHIIITCFKYFIDNPQHIDKLEIVQTLSQNLRKQALNDYSFNQYASCIENYGYPLANQNNLSNQDFTHQVLENLLINYVRHYKNQAPNDTYNMILNSAINEKFGGSKIHFQNQKNPINSSTTEPIQHIVNTAQLYQNPMPPQHQTYTNPNYFNPSNSSTSSPPTNKNQSHYQQLSPQNQLHTSPQFPTLTFYEDHMLNHLYNTISINHCNMVQQYPYIKSACEALNCASYNLSKNSSDRFKQLQGSVNNQINYALSFFGQNVGSQGSCYYEIQSWMIVMIHIYKCFQNNYDPYRRRCLKLIFNCFNNQNVPKPIQYLRWLQSNRKQILLLQPTQYFISKSRAIIFDIYNKRNTFLKDMNFNDVPNFLLINLSPLELKRKKIVNIWIAGFLSQDMDKKSHWKDLTNFMPSSQIYAVQWSSDKISHLAKFMGKACIDLITAPKIKEQLQKKYTQNPFIPAIQVSINLGRYLAEMLIRLFPNQFVNILGYSLGSELIKSCMERLVELKRESILNNIYLLGGVTDTTQIQTIISNSSYPWCIYNLYNGNDMVLKHILSLCVPDSKPIGINKIQGIKGHQIINIDCSYFISGHLAYMSNYAEVGRVTDMNKQ